VLQAGGENSHQAVTEPKPLMVSFTSLLYLHLHNTTYNDDLSAFG
jgi:hypothetical protein